MADGGATQMVPRIVADGQRRATAMQRTAFVPIVSCSMITKKIIEPAMRPC
jgi:hypothetical protein